MEARVLLRFRNVVSGTKDGIGDHIEIMNAGHVWWGWWRRTKEPDRESDLRKLDTPFPVVGVSPAERVGFSATVQEVLIGSSPPETAVPSYYRDKISEVPVWFKLTKIERLLGKKLEQLCQLIAPEVRTLFFEEEVNELVALPERIESMRVPSPYIIHISDVHLGDDHAFVQPGERPWGGPHGAGLAPHHSLADAVAADLDRANIDPGLILITGDLVTKNKWVPRERAGNFIRELCDSTGVPLDRIVAIPGNHDFFRGDERPEDLSAIAYQHEDSFRVFLNSVWNIKANAPLERVIRLQFDDLPYSVLLGCLNSARWTTVPGFTEYGFVGRDHMDTVVQMIRSAPGPTVRLLTLHHHVVAVGPHEWVAADGDSKPVSVTLDAGHILDEAIAAGVRVILHGHQHTPLITKIARRRLLRTSDVDNGELNSDVHVLSGGTAGSTECEHAIGNCYGVLEMRAETGRYSVRGLDPNNAGSRELGSAVFPLVPVESG